MLHGVFLAESGLLKDLEDMLGKEDARVIGALAVYMLDKGVSMNSFADWLWPRFISPVCSRYVDSAFSELLAKIEPDMVDNFFPETSSAGHNAGSGSQTGTLRGKVSKSAYSASDAGV